MIIVMVNNWQDELSNSIKPEQLSSPKKGTFSDFLELFIVPILDYSE